MDGWRDGQTEMLTDRRMGRYIDGGKEGCKLLDGVQDAEM